ncbi:hypothetical protein [Pyxidicoccus trucidator]|uniref:hypothetical protein n=1 Tax=Pyxidicoccus trucidator TaxID=2709662 RepID=UPI0013DA7B5C|nr:hypothetical protein [Pyxidicoccus trucidator]
MTDPKAEAPYVVTEPEFDEPSPHAWVADRVWRQRRQWSRFALENLRETELVGIGEEGSLAVPVTPELFARAPVAPVDPAAPVPPEGPLEAQQERLSTTREVGAEFAPTWWPVCCQRLVVLTLVNPTAGELADWERSHLPLSAEALDDLRYSGLWMGALEDVRAGREPCISFNVYQCHACGRIHARLAKYPKLASR